MSPNKHEPPSIYPLELDGNGQGRKQGPYYTRTKRTRLLPWEIYRRRSCLSLRIHRIAVNRGIYTGIWDPRSSQVWYSNRNHFVSSLWPVYRVQDRSTYEWGMWLVLVLPQRALCRVAMLVRNRALPLGSASWKIVAPMDMACAPHVALYIE